MRASHRATLSYVIASYAAGVIALLANYHNYGVGDRNIALILAAPIMLPFFAPMAISTIALWIAGLEPMQGWPLAMVFTFVSVFIIARFVQRSRLGRQLSGRVRRLGRRAGGLARER